MIILNKSDLSDPSANEAWENRLKEEGSMVTAMNCMKGQGTKQLLKLLSSLQAEKNEGKIRKKPLRMMIVGVPNVGKSSLNKQAHGQKERKDGRQAGGNQGKTVAFSGERHAALRHAGNLMA